MYEETACNKTTRPCSCSLFNTTWQGVHKRLVYFNPQIKNRTVKSFHQHRAKWSAKQWSRATIKSGMQPLKFSKENIPHTLRDWLTTYSATYPLATADDLLLTSTAMGALWTSDKRLCIKKWRLIKAQWTTRYVFHCMVRYTSTPGGPTSDVVLYDTSRWRRIAPKGFKE